MGQFISSSEKETKQIAGRLARQITRGVIALSGELGAGKTTFVQGVAKGLKVKSRIISPTFVLIREHKAYLSGKKINFYHIDLYRIEDSNQVKDLGLSDLFQEKTSVFLIEWGRKFDLNSNWNIEFLTSGQTKRNIKIKRNE